MSKTKYIKNRTEKFDASKLSFILNNRHIFKHLMRPETFSDKQYTPFKICKNYLEKSVSNKAFVNYRQKDGEGRFFAMGSLSLQTMPREIRQAIAHEYYTDIDMVNCQPVILEYICKKEGMETPFLTIYNKEREKKLEELMDMNDITRDNVKALYISIMNGGKKDFKQIKYKTEHLRNFYDEMEDIKYMFINKKEEEYISFCEKKGHQKNMLGKFVNKFLTGMENEILMEMYRFFGEPENVVFCFDGLMLMKEGGYNIKKCEEQINKKYEGLNMRIKAKDMIDIFEMDKYDIPDYNGMTLDYFVDFRKLINKEVEFKVVDTWCRNSIKVIENNGKHHFITKSIDIEIFGDGTTERRMKWNIIKPKEISASLDVNCKVINPEYDEKVEDGYLEIENRNEAKKYQKENKMKMERYLYNNLSRTNKMSGVRGFLSKMMENRSLETYNSTDYFPFLKRKGEPELFDTFNLFTGFPIELIENYDERQFEKSLLYRHLRYEFFNDNAGELNHFLDHIADIIQDPANIKGTSHLFYSRQGCGKGLLFKFMTKLLGVNNVVSIVNTDAYFDKNFNINHANKLLKIFEEVSEKGSAFKNHNRLKGEQTSDTERIEPKGIDAFSNRNCARYWYATNNENSLFIEGDDRRHTLHRLNDRYANNHEYFKPIWEEISDINFMATAFEYFANREYDMKNVRQAFTTNYKKEQKNSNLSRGIKFILDYVEKNDEINKIEDIDIKIPSQVLREAIKEYSDKMGSKMLLSAFHTHIKKIGIKKPIRLRIITKDGTQRAYCYKINTYKLEQNMKSFLKDEDYKLDLGQEMEEVDEKEVLMLQDDIPYY
jgi:hypothetical protein